MDVITIWAAVSSLACLGGVLLCIGLNFRLRTVRQQHEFLSKQQTKLEEDCSTLQGSLQVSQRETQAAQLRATQLETELRFQKQEQAERLKTYQDAEQRLGQSFQILSQNALRQSHESFLQLARSVLEQHETRAQGDLDLRHQAVHQLIQPLHQALDKVHERMHDVEKQRVGAYQGLQEQVGLLLDAQRRLQLEATNLSTALRSPTTRGRWGELQLRRVVELAGMQAYCDFYEQATLQHEGRTQRPDMIVRLPGNRSIAIDAKVPLSAYLEAIDCQDEDKQKQLLQQHAILVRKQVQALGQKSYWEQLGGSPEFVLLYLPGEAFYSAALQADPSLLEVGADHRVLITTPTSLIALLRASAVAWRQEDLAQNAQEISRIGRELYQRLCDLSGHVADMGKGLQNGVLAYNKLVGNLESRVLVSARRFQELKADDPKKELRALDVIETAPRVWHLDSPTTNA